MALLYCRVFDQRISNSLLYLFPPSTGIVVEEYCPGTGCIKKVIKVNYDQRKRQPIRNAYFVLNHYLNYKNRD